MTRADEVRRLAEDLHETDCLGQGGMNCYACRRQAEKLLEKGWTKPEPPAPRNPVSRETAESYILAYWQACSLTDGRAEISDQMRERVRHGLLAAAPSLVADLAEAAKDGAGTVAVKDGLGITRWVYPAALVAALTRADA